MNHVSFANRWNADAVDAMYKRWCDDPTAVDEQWRIFFDGYELGNERLTAPSESELQARVFRLVYAYRDAGHLAARLDPLGDSPPMPPILELSSFGFEKSVFKRELDSSSIRHTEFEFSGNSQSCTLGQMISALRETYCGTIGVEYMHMHDTPIRRWLQKRMEPCRNQPSFSFTRQLRILMELHYADMFERFLHTKYIGQKRFSIEGAEAFIPLMDALVEKAAHNGVREIVIGMAHRGRLNVLANILGKPYSEIFNEFEENYLPESFAGDGDVKYHLGFSADRTCTHGKTIHLSLTPNPSHLEAVDAVVQGRMRAKQTHSNDEERVLGLPLLVHGDAAFAGQGVVAETLNLSQLSGFKTGGTIHVIINNQIGFTTSPRDARSSLYCTDVAKMIQAPIFHVNGDDVEAVVFVAELALAFRQTFHQDVVIDMYCFRRHGHNETDEPAYTQPVLYDKIENHPSVRELYERKLKESHSLDEGEISALQEEFQGRLKTELKKIKSGPPQPVVNRTFFGAWEGLTPNYSYKSVETGVGEEILQAIATQLVDFPEGFQPHRKIAKQIKQRVEKFTAGEPIDWAFAETMAFGTLLLEGTEVRLTGQDSRRGTFSQRHAVLFDENTGELYCALRNLAAGQGSFLVYDSLLSEEAVVGFEFGYSLDSPHSLVLWEAQFGDFVNGAQVIIDQFISCSYSKWQRDSGLVMLLPHAYEGQGPEHSSARLERFLQQCAEDNLQVCNPSTPAQYFHLLRRQVRRDFRKPLIVMTPKSLLRHPLCRSAKEELLHGCFHETLGDDTVDAEHVKRLIFCSGKVFYDLVAKRSDDNAAAITRVEQFYPFPREQVKAILQCYKNVDDVVWVQEESANMGGWSFMEPLLRGLGADVRYVGRDASASPATGSHMIHEHEQEELIETALRGRAPHWVRRVPHPREPDSSNGKSDKTEAGVLQGD